MEIHFNRPRPSSSSSLLSRQTRKRTRTIGWSLTLAAISFGLTSCETIRHQFAEPARDWQAKSGQLLYRGKKTTLIGEVLVRFSKSGDLELTFTKGPGIMLLEIKQDATFARARGPLARGTWSGPIAEAPARLSGWLHLREVLIAAGEKPSVRHSAGAETFIFRF